MRIKDKLYRERFIAYKGLSIQFKNYHAEVPDKVAAELLATGQYELAEIATPALTLFDFKAESWEKERKLVFDTAIGFANGYGKSGMMIAEALGDEVDTYVMSNEWIGYEDGHISPKLAKLIKKRLRTIDTWYLQYWPAFNFRPIARRQVGYTMLECSRIPHTWVDAINRSNERTIVPCEYMKEVFYNCGVKTHIEVIPLGITPELFPYVEREKDDAFVFGIMGTLTFRKGPDILVKAFRKAFPAKKFPDVFLLIKTLPLGGMTGGFMTKEDLEDERIMLNTEKLSPADLITEFFAKIDCFAFPTRGEGFGLPPMEAMATGLPVIATNFSGCADFMDKKYNYPLDYKIVDVPNGTPGGYPPDLQVEGQQWAEPDMDHLIALMREVYNNREKAIAKGKKASKWARTEWTAKQTAKKIVAYLDKKV
jgi:glycosyltransferase involved in cell wall biosynthesis